MKYEVGQQEVIDMVATALGIKKGRGRFKYDPTSNEFSVVIESEAEVLQFRRPDR
jgi:hypothetical protein